MFDGGASPRAVSPAGWMRSLRDGRTLDVFNDVHGSTEFDDGLEGGLELEELDGGTILVGVEVDGLEDGEVELTTDGFRGTGVEGAGLSEKALGDAELFVEGVVLVTGSTKGSTGFGEVLVDLGLAFAAGYTVNFY